MWREIIKISRPRFWLYELGTYFIGVLAALVVLDLPLNTLFSPLVLAFAFFFMIPANIFIYGINDIYDYETDKLNPKKVEYENLLLPEKHLSVWLWIIFTCLPFLVLALVSARESLWALLLFFCFAGFYSAPPLRAKTIPFLDSVFSAGHYIFTGVFAYYLVFDLEASVASFPFWAVIAGMSWAVAMHAYSAVPDIKADKEAGLKTIATTLGKNGTLFLCLALYIFSAFTFAHLINNYAYLAGAVYMYIIFKTLRTDNEQEVFQIYTYFPIVNLIIPMIWCFFFIINNFTAI